MSDAFTVRNYTHADFDSFTRLYSEAEELEPAGRCTFGAVIAERLNRPGYSPEKDLFISEVSGTLAGFTDIKAELGINRVILDCWVSPQFRGKGIADGLFRYSAARARDAGAGVVHVNIAEDNLAANKKLMRLGFRYVRMFLEMETDITTPGSEEIDSAVCCCRPLQNGDEEKLALIQNVSFAGSWGYNPGTISEITYRTHQINHSPEDILLVYQDDKLAGYCWTEPVCEGSRFSTGKGRILMLGVAPEFRGKGIGRKALLAGMAHLKSEGLSTAVLTVDNENKVACRLYHSVGFEVRKRTHWYEKSLE